MEMLNRKISSSQDRIRVAYLLIAFCLGLLPSFIVYSWANHQVDDLRSQYDLMSSANTGNSERDVIERLRLTCPQSMYHISSGTKHVFPR